MKDLNIRKATSDDCETLYNLLKEMREGEGRLEAFILTFEEFKRDGFGEDKLFESHVVELKDGKEVIGFAMCFFGFNGDCGKILYLEDIYIKPAYRSKGYGTLVFKYIAKVTLDSGARRMEWCVMNDPSWNAKTIEFYKKFNSIDENLKQLYLQGDVLKKCAEF
ncbi:thialysine N-epsilon-acetyltransferase-like [Saccostrea echinata]|uniref:thialysine N-epsilon-acetyltransferase-like n=1 Tax=Saccostrea echinata TaxID=191078 RepID=UPI002A804CED|nr:thialysine N-epsilon-acetyltransferase-like [Saccostrea echinata]